MRLLQISLLYCLFAAPAVAESPFDNYQVYHPLHDDLTVIAYHDVREDIKRDFAADAYAVSAENLAMHFSWLRDNGYTVVDINDVLAALDGGRPLPEKSVLLTFDDGLESIYHAVYPLLTLFDYPALISVVTSWIETEVEVQYENHKLSSRDFLTWEQMRTMLDSGLIEIGSHTHDMHQGIHGNPQRNLQPAAVTRLYTDRYETRNEYLQRIEQDIATSARLIKQKTGRAPRVVVWPYGQYNSDVRNIAALHGMELSLSLDQTDTETEGFPVLGRELMVENPGIYFFAQTFTDPAKPEILRAAQVDLDYVYDPDPEQQEANLGVLLDRIKALRISHVFLQAFADPDANGSAAELYFPNRHLPVRADLFSRVAWQLKTRSSVRVFAWMPLMAYDSKHFDPSWKVIQQSTDEPDPKGEPRLSPFHPDARQFVREIYEDLAAYTAFDGVLIHNDGRFNEQEDASPTAMAAYRLELGNDFDIQTAHDDPQLLQKWSRLKTQALIDFSDELTDILRERKPDLKTARNLFAPVVLDPSSEAWFAQSLSLFLERYDYVALMAMPYMENSADPNRFLGQLATAVAQHEGGMERTIFELQTVDWRTGTEIPAETLFRQMRNLQAAGVKHLAYYPDDFITDRPALNQIRQGISLADYPFYRR